MKRYSDYMDGVEVSDILHEKLKNLEEPKKKPRPWAKYGAAAAALVLAAGAGAWGLSRGGWDAANAGWGWDIPAISTAEVGREEIPAADIVPAGPNAPNSNLDAPSYGGGYEVVDGEIAEYIFLPALNWTDASTQSQALLNYSLAPPDAVQRDATWDDVQMFAGGEKAMANHLLWDEGMGWGGTLWFEEDGTPCAAELYSGYTNKLYGIRLYLEIRKGHEVPSCVALPDEYYDTSLWQGVKITALKNDGYIVTNDGTEFYENREVSFFYDGVGYKLTLHANDAQRADELCARYVRYAVDGGFSLSALPFRAGDLPNKGLPPEDAPGGNNESFSCPYCADGTVHTHPYDPGADIVVTAPPYSAAN